MIILRYFTSTQKESTVHTPDGWLQVQRFSDPETAFSALTDRWCVGDVEADLYLEGKNAGPLTLDIQHDFRSTVGTAGVQKIAKELYDERIAYWVRGEQP